MIHTHTFEVGGKTLSIETGRVAKQAGGSVLLGMGETVVLGTATMSKTAREGIDFLPLVCDFEERKYSIGKIPGGFVKRGGRPSEKSILTSRLIDRPIRPLFPKGMRNDVQVVTMAFSVDKECPPALVRAVVEGRGDGAELWQTLAGLEWPGLTVPAELGGSGATFVELALLLEIEHGHDQAR